MDTVKQSSAFERFGQTIIASYRQLFDLDFNVPVPQMPQRQIEFFATSAFEQHFLLAIRLRNESYPVVGRIDRFLDSQRLLFHDINSNVYRIVPLVDCLYIQRTRRQR